MNVVHRVPFAFVRIGIIASRSKRWS